MKKLQFKRVDKTLKEMLRSQIISEGNYEGNSDSIKWGFYLSINGSFKYYIIFNKIDGSYRLGAMNHKGEIDIISEEAYRISGLRRLLKNEFYNLVYQYEIENIFLKNK